MLKIKKQGPNGKKKTAEVKDSQECISKPYISRVVDVIKLTTSLNSELLICRTNDISGLISIFSRNVSQNSINYGD